MKKLIIATAFLFLMGFAAGLSHAEDITASGLNIKEFLSNTRAGLYFPLSGGKTYKTVYSPIIWLHGSDGTEYVSLDVGAAAPGEITKGYFYAALGFRIDNLLDRALNLSGWIKTHISSAKLPTLEASGGAILVGNKILPGGGIAVKF